MDSVKPLPPLDSMSGTLRENILALTQHQRENAERASFSDKLAEAVTRFTGSMRFVVLHLVFYGSWIVVNLGWVPGVQPFDPTFVVLAMEASVEAIFLSTFVLISQNRMARDSRRRADLDLHISLLTEHELTKLVSLADRIARRLDAGMDDPELPEIERDVEPVAVLDALEAERQREGLQD